MRHNDARKWLHAGLDLLPIILIPVFMIYSHRHDLSTDINIQQDVVKDFYQGVKNGKPTSTSLWDLVDLDNDEPFTDYYYGSNSERLIIEDSDNWYLSIKTQTDIYYSASDYLYISFNYFTDYTTDFDLYFGDGDSSELGIEGESMSFSSDDQFYSTIYHDDINSVQINYFQIIGFFNELHLWDVQIFNLTTIFGSGNEPTKEVFESYLLQDYYDFGSNEVKIGVVNVPAKNNDIMSVFMDSFNNSINKYFNMGNVFNLTPVYQWFNTNIFGGNAPTIIYSVWNIALYELCMDLLFLLYGLFMWFIDMCKHLMEKPFRSIK